MVKANIYKADMIYIYRTVYWDSSWNICGMFAWGPKHDILRHTLDLVQDYTSFWLIYQQCKELWDISTIKIEKKNICSLKNLNTP